MNLKHAALALLITAVPGTTLAQDAPGEPDPLAGLLACAQIADDGARLACYDASAEGLRHAQASGDLVAIDRARVQEIERESFGFSLSSVASLLPNRRAEEAQGPAYVDLVVAQVLNRGDGPATFVMADGQRWAQVEAQSVQNVRVGDTIRIRRAALGSYLLTPEHGRAHRVRRVN